MEQDIVREGGKLSGGSIGTSAAGGPRKFCEQQDALVVVSGSSGAWHLECPTQCPSIGLQEVLLSEIRWSQDCIRVSFRKGRGLLVDLLKELERDPKLVHSLARFDVAVHGGALFAISGNRRLWVLKEYAARHDPTLKIQVRVRDHTEGMWAKVFKMRFSTKNRGQHVDIVLKHRLMKCQRFQTMKLAVEALRRQNNSESDSESASIIDSSSSQTAASSSSGSPASCRRGALRPTSISSCSSD